MTAADGRLFELPAADPYAARRRRGDAWRAAWPGLPEGAAVCAEWHDGILQPIGWEHGRRHGPIAGRLLRDYLARRLPWVPLIWGWQADPRAPAAILTADPDAAAIRCSALDAAAWTRCVRHHGHYGLHLAVTEEIERSLGAPLTAVQLVPLQRVGLGYAPSHPS